MGSRLAVRARMSLGGVGEANGGLSEVRLGLIRPEETMVGCARLGGCWLVKTRLVVVKFRWWRCW